MANDNIIFCGQLLKAVRAEAREMRVKIPKLTTWNMTMGSNSYYEVWGDGTLLWSGNASCASDAKYQYISALLDSELEGK